MFEEGQEFLIDGESCESMNDGNFCMEEWDAINRYVYAAIQGGAIMRGRTNDENDDCLLQ